MLNRKLALGLAIALAAGCVAEEDAADGWLDPGGKADDGSGYPAVIIDESGDGQLFDVLDGQEVIVRLPLNPTTGYQWVVAETDRTFGYPNTTEFAESSRAAGRGGFALLVWKTGALVPMIGRHTVVLELRRVWEDPRVTAAARSFTFTVDIQRDGPPAIVIEEGDEGGSFELIQGQDIIVRLTSNPTTGYEWIVVATDRTLGHPAHINQVPSSESTGGGGYTELVWDTDTPLDLTGEHRVLLELRRSWEPPEIASVRSFGFSVEIHSPGSRD